MEESSKEDIMEHSFDKYDALLLCAPPKTKFVVGESLAQVNIAKLTNASKERTHCGRSERKREIADYGSLYNAILADNSCLWSTCILDRTRLPGAVPQQLF